MVLILFVAAEWGMITMNCFKPLSGYLGRYISKFWCFLGQISIQFLLLSQIRISDKILNNLKKIGEGSHLPSPN